MAINYTAMNKTDLAMVLEEGEGSEETHTQFIGNINDGTILGYKYFEISRLNQIRLGLRGKASGHIAVATDFEFQNVVGETAADIDTVDWSDTYIDVKIPSGKNALFFRFSGEGSLDMKEFELIEEATR